MLPPDCESALHQLDAFRRGELPADAMASLREHLDACRRCLTFNQFEEAFLQRLVDAAQHCNCPDGLRTSIYQMIAKEARE